MFLRATCRVLSLAALGGAFAAAPAASQDLPPVPSAPSADAVPPNYPARVQPAPLVQPPPRAEEPLRIPARIATRLRVLETDLNALSARGARSVANGILGILTGGLSITLGLVVDGDEALSRYLYLFGSASVASGVIDLAINPNPTKPAIQYAHLPMTNVEEVKERLRYGELSLESLAHQRRLARILDGAVNVGAGIAVVPLFLAPNDFKVDDTFDVFVLIGAGVSLITGTVNLVTQTEAEQRWSAYQTLRAQMREERKRILDQRKSSSHIDISANLGGASINWRSAL